MIVVPGPASRNLGQRVATILGAMLCQVDYKLFPDGESYIRLNGKIDGEEVAIVQSCSPPQDKNFLTLLLMIDVARDLGAETIYAIVPYFAYARQDRRFLEGEAVSAKTLAKLVEAAGADRFLTFDIHNAKILQFFKIPASDLSAMPLIARRLGSMNLSRPFIVAPDDGGSHLAESVGAILGTESSYFEKRRDLVTGAITMSAKNLDVAGRDTVIVDDLISTGSSMINAARLLKRQGAKNIIAACTHALMIGDAPLKMREAGITEIIATDTIEGSASIVSVAEIVAEALRKRK